MTHRIKKLGNGRRHRGLFAVAALSPILLGTPAAVATPRLLEVEHFQFEQQAQQHCPDDVIVWAIVHLGVYNSSAERWYGQTNDGSFVCRKDAEAAGYRASRAAQ